MNTQRMVEQQTEAALKSRAAGRSAPACSTDEWRTVAIAALDLAGELVAELRMKCPDPIHAAHANQIADMLKQCTTNAGGEGRQPAPERHG